MFLYLLAGFALGVVVVLITIRITCVGTLNVLKTDSGVIDMYLAANKPIEYIKSQPYVKLKVAVKSVDSRK